MNLEPASKVLASGCIIRDQSGRILLVKPTYKPGWEIPGGMVEANESPAQACVREVREELGLEVELGRLLCVEYVGLEPERLLFVFDAGSSIVDRARASASNCVSREWSCGPCELTLPD